MTDNLPMEGIGAVLSFIPTPVGVDDGERQDQNPSLATVDRGSSIVTGPPSITTGCRGQPNACVRSVARALAKCSSCGSPCFVGAEVNAIGGSRIMQSVDLIYRAEKIPAEVNVDTCLNFIRGVF